MTEHDEQGETNEARSRTRPRTTIIRDNEVHATLVELGESTRAKLADVLGWRPGVVYACLYRLRKENRVRKRDGSQMWEPIHDS